MLMDVFASLGVFVIFVIIVSLAIPIIGIVMVAKDQSLNSTAKLLWVIIILFFNILGVIAYLLLRES